MIYKKNENLVISLSNTEFIAVSQLNQFVYLVYFLIIALLSGIIMLLVVRILILYVSIIALPTYSIELLHIKIFRSALHLGNYPSFIAILLNPFRFIFQRWLILLSLIKLVKELSIFVVISIIFIKTLFSFCLSL